jgi:hypothetical protein
MNNLKMVLKDIGLIWANTESKSVDEIRMYLIARREIWSYNSLSISHVPCSKPRNPTDLRIAKCR